MCNKSMSGTLEQITTLNLLPKVQKYPKLYTSTWRVVQYRSRHCYPFSQMVEQWQCENAFTKEHFRNSEVIKAHQKKICRRFGLVSGKMQYWRCVYELSECAAEIRGTTGYTQAFFPNKIEHWQAILQGCIMTLNDLRIVDHLTSQRTHDMRITVVAIRALLLPTLRNITGNLPYTVIK